MPSSDLSLLTGDPVQKSVHHQADFSRYDFSWDDFSWGGEVLGEVAGRFDLCGWLFPVLGVDSATWSSDWAWGLPLIVLTVVIHVLGLGLIGRQALRASSSIEPHRYPLIKFVILVGTTTLLATCLHGIEVVLWAKAFRLLGALPDLKWAILYSLNAITSYGHTTLTLEPKWQLMGAMESLNGWLLFGLTTAFLFSIIEKAWPLRHGRGRTGDDETR